MSSTADCRMIKTTVPQNVPQNVAAFYTCQEYVKEGKKTLVVLERPLSD